MEDIDVIGTINRIFKSLAPDNIPATGLVLKKLQLLSKQIWTSSDRHQMLGVLTSLLLKEDLTLIIAENFCPMLLELLSHAVTLEIEEESNFTRHELIGVALGKLVGSYPVASKFCFQYYETHPSILENIIEEREPCCKKARKANSFVDDHLKKLLQASFQLLVHNCQFFSKRWNWGSLIGFIEYKQLDVRWLACHCIAVVSGMSNSCLHSFLLQHFNDKEILDLRLKYVDILHPKWAKQNLTLFIQSQDHTSAKSHSKGHFMPSDLCENVLSVSDVLIRRIKSSEVRDQSKNMVLVPSIKSALRSLVLGVAASDSILLQGPVGCGKTALVEYLAAETGRIGPPHLIKVQVGDQMDSKLLVGSHCCTDVPGEFVWRPGPLTQAMTNGYWLLLEDINYAPMDIISLLVPVLHSRSIVLPGHAEPLKAASGFQLFATQRLHIGHEGMQSEFRSHSDLLSKLWRKVTIELMSRTELEEVIITKWPMLKSISSRILDIYFTILVGSQPENQSFTAKNPMLGGRIVSTRDLLKWCLRTSTDFDIKSIEKAVIAFQDAFDCFCRSIPSTECRLSLAKSVGTELNLSDAKAEYYCEKHKPNISLSADFLKVGRAVLKRIEDIVIQRNQMTFAHTRQALSLLESIAVAVGNQEPVLLVGETGTGKTSIIQYLANLLGYKLTVINMNQQSDSVDLLGGYKPLELKLMLSPLHEEFEEIFNCTFSHTQNMKFLGHIMNCFISHRWQDLFKLMIHTQKIAVKKFESRKDCNEREINLLCRWKKLGVKVQQLQTQVKQVESALAFSFIEGSLVKAIRKGEWILLDEINLAEAETLECMAGLLESSAGSILLAERGDREPVTRHPDFCLFACMNPATDIGKKDLPPGIRNRFTEFYMEELEDEIDLVTLVNSYLKELSLSSRTLKNIVEFYIHIRKEATTTLSDGTGHHPIYSLRTLCRALSYVARNPCGSVPRSLYEGFCLSFLTQLDRTSYPLVIKLIVTYLLEKKQLSVLKHPLPKPINGDYMCFEGYWIHQGTKEPTISQNYILTPSIRQNLRDLARVVSAGKQPVLLQGETSVGKTSLVQWLAAASGNHCVRVNNHEHTDLQEYLGSYCASDEGKLTFKKGILAEAMMHGYWIILDELNLAPSEVLEALNRVLDDNRELYIPEIQLTIKAHPQFMLFATQNPPGLYGGRKLLSRAFRNRFVELHFDEIPSAELERILHERCAVPPSYCKKLVAVMLELQLRRRESGIFAGKRSYITLRDLFRWGERYRLAPEQTEPFYDWNEHLANEGYILLAGRVRKQEEADVIQEVIEKQMKSKIDPHKLFITGKGCKSILTNVLERIVMESLPKEFQHIVWTYNMKRLAVLVGQALKFNEPVLLIGETGCSKTTVCQLFAAFSGRKLFSINCHMHSESSDFLGGLRPGRQNQREVENPKLFEWVDGPLITSMKSGAIFLADEISLADDSVLERLNSVLEPERTVLLAEKAESANNYEEATILAEEGFQFLATMNPGGDFGKKELSPALRNRFTEIWCPSTTGKEDMISIIRHNLTSSIITEETKFYIGKVMIEFIDWFKSELSSRSVTSIRDILAWTNFINHTTSRNCICPLNLAEAYIHGACLVYLDSLGSGTTCFNSFEDVKKARMLGMKQLAVQMKPLLDSPSQSVNIATAETCLSDVMCDKKYFGIHPFYIVVGSCADRSLEGVYTLESPTVNDNSLRLLRAMQLSKPILLEGVPGVGKTSLVTSLAKASGNKVVRINLSEQTDISDLFGADLPVEGKCGEFAWRDGLLLQALKSGSWIVLDELNLASQSVLEGLNACLDHRGEIFIPELGKSFQIQHEKTWIFGCQNPHKQGGARKGLPKSFLNRFAQVYIEPMSPTDLMFISHVMFPLIPKDIIAKMVEFNQKLSEAILAKKLWGQKGSPWEFNLRDIFRWCEVLLHNQDVRSLNPGMYIELIYADRMRTTSDKIQVVQLYKNVFDCHAFPLDQPPLQLRVMENYVQVGYSFLSREGSFPNSIPLFPLHYQLKPLQSLMKCIEMKWMAILVGSSVGKTSLVNMVATLTGHPLLSLTVSSEMDTTELLGGFEQADLTRHLDQVSQLVETVMRNILWLLLLSGKESHAQADYILERWFLYQQLQFQPLRSELNDEVVCLKKRINALMVVIESLTCSLLSNILVEELQSAKEELKRIEQLLKSNGIVSSGGRFEWVDSMLVTAVKRGYWLLIDDVNFCSPSVLDRLNGLLETNGVLTISEKGVIGEEIPTIKPHPNFRLILAMDPRNGEISRAMRNRGVEIYVLAQDEGCDPSYLDMCKLIHSRNLHDPLVIDMLLKIHKRISKEIKDVEKFTLLDLLNAASVCSQVIQCGSSSKKALWECCHSIFANNAFSSPKKQEIEYILKEEIQKFPISSNELLFRSISSLMPTSLDIHIDSVLSHLKEESILLHCLLHDMANSDTICETTVYKHEIDFTTTLPVPINSLKKEKQINLIACIVQLFMETATTSDWELRKCFIHHVTSKFLKENKRDCLRDAVNCLNKFVCSLNIHRLPVTEQLTSYTKKLLSYTDFSDTLIDLRWNLPLLQRLLLLAKEDFSDDLVIQLESAANRFLLLLVFSSMKFIEEQISLKQNLSKNQDSLVELAKKYCDNKIMVNDLPHPVLQHLLSFLSSLNEEILSILGKKVFICQTEDISKFRNVLQHCSHFIEVCNQIYEKHLVQHHLSLFALHWTWMEKNVFPLITQYHDAASKETSNLYVIISVIRKNLEINIPITHKLRPKLVKLLGSSVPFQTSDAAMIFLEVQRLSDALDIKKYIHNGSCHGQLLSLYKIGPNCMEQLLSALHAVQNFCSGQSLAKAEESVLNAQKTMTQEGLIKGNEPLDELSLKSEGNNHIVQLESHIQLLPLIDYLYILNMHQLLFSVMRVTPNITTTKHPQSLEDADKNITHKLQLLHKVEMETLLYPYGYLNEFGNFHSPFESRNVTRSFVNFFTHLQVSPSSSDIAHYLTWNPYQAQDENDQRIHNDADRVSISTWEQNDIWAQQMPLRTFICMMLQGSLKSLSLTIGNFFEKSKQLGMVNQILWNNVFSFCDIINSFRRISLNIVHVWFNSVVCCLLRVSSENIIQDINSVENIYQLASELKLPEEIHDLLLRATNSVNTLCNAAKSDNCSECSLSWALGKAWAYVGLLTMQLLAPRDVVDPVEKWKLKLNYCQSELENITVELGLRNLQSQVLTGKSLLATTECHPFIKDQMNQLQTTKDRISKLKSKIAYRPTYSQFQDLKSDVHHYLMTVGSSSMICSLLKKLDDCKISFKDVNDEMLCNIDDLLQEVDKWNSSQCSFVNKLQRCYPLYCDLTTPFISGIKQMAFGMQLARYHISALNFKSHFDRKDFFSLEHLIINLIKFPSLGICSKQEVPFPHFISQSDIMSQLEKVLSAASDRKKNNIYHNLIKLSMSALLELRNEVIISAGIHDENVVRIMTKLLQFLCKMWQQQNETQKEKEEENECLYQLHSSKRRLEENQEELNVTEFFPTYIEDFKDVNPTSGSKCNEVPIKESSVSLKFHVPGRFDSILNQQDMVDIWSIHSIILNKLKKKTPTPVISTLHSVSSCDGTDTDYLSPFMLRYETAQYLLQSVGQHLDSVIDYHTIGANLLANYGVHKNCISSISQGKEQKCYDIYHTPNPSESIHCHHLLRNLAHRVELLLEEFPSHPSLKQIILVTDRIMGFPINAPLMKFLTGLEMVLTVSQEWEVNSHKGVSLSNELSSITEMILKWRKLELRCWSECLNTVFNKQYSNCAIWWLHLYQLLMPLISEEVQDEDINWKKDDIEKFLKTLSEYFEQSTLGEYRARLDLLSLFIEQTNQSPHKNSTVFSMLYNIYHFYHQFLPQIDNKISLERKPIEKDIKDYIKIARWNDINFWAVKQTAEKSHHTIYKHMKQFEKILRQPVTDHLLLHENAETILENQWEFTFHLDEFVSSLSLQEYIQDISMYKNAGITRQKYKKMVFLCKKIFRASQACNEINYISKFAGNVAAAAKELASLDISKDADSERRKKEAHYIHARKQKALSDLFKELTSSGLSYKLGLILWNEVNTDDLMTLPPIDINQLLVTSGTSRKADLTWQNLQDSIHKYFRESLVKRNLMTLALESPSKDLNPSNIERCKGFIGHLFHLLIQQHQKLFCVSHSLLKTRKLLFNIEGLVKRQNPEKVFLPPQTFLEKWMERIHKLSVHIIRGIEEFIVILECCPNENNDPVFTSEPVDDLPPLISTTKGSTLWTEISSKAKSVLELSRSMLQQLPKKSSNTLWFYGDYIALCSACEHLSAIAEQVKLLKAYAESDDKENCLADSLRCIMKEIVKTTTTFKEEVCDLELKMQEHIQPNKQEVFAEKLAFVIAKLGKKLLLTTQKEYLNEKTKEVIEENEIIGKFITDGVINKLNISWENMHLAKVERLYRKIEKLIKTINSVELDVSEINKVISVALPFIDQYANLVQFLVITQTASYRSLCKLLYILLHIFTELVRKGFCVPLELQKEISDKEGTIKFTDIEDGGLGDGEGSKDVSERLESEDQLEEARKADDYNREKEEASDQQDIREEEHGVEMSDDFDGKLHDPEVEDNVSEKSTDDDDDSDHDNLDKKMGDVSKEEEALDTELWGSDESDDDDDDDDMKEDDRRKGKAKTDSSVVAKDKSRDEEKVDEKADKERNETKPPEINDLEEYDGEYPNKPDNTEEIPDSVDLPEDLQLDKNINDSEDSQDENMEEDKSTENIENQELEDEQQMDIDEETKLNENNEECDLTKQEGEGQEKECEQEYSNDEGKEISPDENEAEAANVPSTDNSTTADALPSDSIDKSCSKDAVQITQETLEEAPIGGKNAAEEQHGHGSAECNNEAGTEAHEGNVVSSTRTSKETESEEYEQIHRLKDLNEERTTGSYDTSVLQVKIIKPSGKETDPSNISNKSDLYEHAKGLDSTCETQVADTATEEQVKEKMPSDSDKQSEVVNASVEEQEELQDIRNISAESFPIVTDSQKTLCSETGYEKMEVDAVPSDDANIIPTMTANRGPHSSIHTQPEYLKSSSTYYLPQHFEHSLKLMSSTELAEKLWQEHTTTVYPLVQELCEQLRLVLEPTKMSKLKGDYRTGKRLNMRKVIPYIASQFRKDKIWLRRTKPSKREYQIVLAVDDSSSMADNRTQQLAFQSLALLAKSLSLLEAGEISVMKFGEDVCLLHPFGDPFTDHSGAQVMQQFTFSQGKTLIAQLLNSATKMMIESQHKPVSNNISLETAQLLIVISDGHGIFSEGRECVKRSVRYVRSNNIFLVLLILDNPENKGSILDMKYTIFRAPDKVEVYPYMEKCPFPFYIILRDINSLPLVLGEALRQWFELVTSTEH